MLPGVVLWSWQEVSVAIIKPKALQSAGAQQTNEAESHVLCCSTGVATYPRVVAITPVLPELGTLKAASHPLNSTAATLPSPQHIPTTKKKC